MFELDKQQAKITSFNPRAEKHGDENVPAGDIRMQVACPNTVLDHFGKGLRPTLYRKASAGEADTTDVRDVPGNLTQRTLPQLKPLRFDGSNEVDSFHALVEPDGWAWDADNEAFKTHGITVERCMDEGIPEPEAVARFLALHARADIRVAHNESFDARILRIAFKRYGHGASGWDMLTQDERDAIADTFKSRPAYCTCNAAKPIMKLPPTEKMAANPRFRNSHKPPNLQEAHQHFLGEAFDGAHGALADAQACARVYFALNPIAEVAA